MSEAVEVIDILDKWQRGEFHGRLEASFPDDRPRSIVSRESRFFGGGSVARPREGKRVIWATAASAKCPKNVKNAERLEREMERLNNMHARISRGAERAFCMLPFTVAVKFNALSFKFQTGKRSCLAYHIRHVAALSQ